MAKRRMTVFHTDGSKTSFLFPKQTDATMMAGEVAKALEKDKIVVEADGAMFLIPLNNVKYIQLTPAPEKLPAGVIKGASVK
jgi:hypothetical protein